MESRTGTWDGVITLEDDERKGRASTERLPSGLMMSFTLEVPDIGNPSETFQMYGVADGLSVKYLRRSRRAYAW